jgi:CDP-paratose 2-epimerase
MLEAIRMIKEISGHELSYSISGDARIGDHIWYVSDVRKFQEHYPDWKYEYDIRKILSEMIAVAERSAAVYGS